MDKTTRKIATQIKEVSKANSKAYNALWKSMFGRGHVRRKGKLRELTFDAATVERNFFQYLVTRSRQYQIYGNGTRNMMKDLKKLNKADLKKRFGSIESFKATEYASMVYADLLGLMSQDILMAFLLAKVIFAESDKPTDSIRKESVRQAAEPHRHTLLSNKAMASAAMRLYLMKQAQESHKPLPYVG